MSRYKFNEEEKKYINELVKNLRDAREYFKEDEVKKWIMSFSDCIHANCFYMNTICKNDIHNYYRKYYKTKKAVKPHTVIYLNLGCGYPKELRYGHFAYVHKVENGKALIIPMVSIKNFERKFRSQELQIAIINHGMTTPSILRLDEMRWIDLQRINEKHSVPEAVLTPRKRIIEELKNYLEV